jgi:hypothetical protein
MSQLWFPLPAAVTADTKEYLSSINRACESLSTLLQKIRGSGVVFHSSELSDFKKFLGQATEFPSSITYDELKCNLRDISSSKNLWAKLRQHYCNPSYFFKDKIGSPSITCLIDYFGLTAKLLSASQKSIFAASLFLTVSEHLKFLSGELKNQQPNFWELGPSELFPYSQLYGQLQVFLEFVESPGNQFAQVEQAIHWRDLKSSVKAFGALKDRWELSESLRQAVAVVNAALTRLSTDRVPARIKANSASKHPRDWLQEQLREQEELLQRADRAGKGDKARAIVEPKPQ